MTRSRLRKALAEQARKSETTEKERQYVSASTPPDATVFPYSNGITVRIENDTFAVAMNKQGYGISLFFPRGHHFVSNRQFADFMCQRAVKRLKREPESVAI